jgi:hypothetical protein
VGAPIPADPVGFRVHGRYGLLGVVLAAGQEEGESPPVLVVRGGMSEALTFYVPEDWVRAVSEETRILLVDADIGDFVPSLRRDGTVELRTEGGS